MLLVEMVCELVFPIISSFAVLALVRSYVKVPVLVVSFISNCRELLLAPFATVGSLASVNPFVNLQVSVVVKNSAAQDRFF